MSVKEGYKNLNQYEKGFLEGLIDGEGSISLAKTKTKQNTKWRTNRGFQWQPRMEIGNTNKQLLEKAQKIIREGVITKSGKTKKGVIFWKYTASSNVLRRILPQLQLIVKERQKLYLLKALKILKMGNMPRDMDSYDGELEQIWTQIRILNGGRNLANP